MEATSKLNPDVWPDALDLARALFEREPERLGLALQALWEIESTAARLIEWAQEIEAEDLWVRGSAMRIHSLSRLCMSAVNDGEDTADGLAQILRG